VVNNATHLNMTHKYLAFLVVSHLLSVIIEHMQTTDRLKSVPWLINQLQALR